LYKLPVVFIVCAMGRRPLIPVQLKRGPFTLNEARHAGLTPSRLRGDAWHRLGIGLYRWSGWRENPWQLIGAWSRLLPRDVVFAGATAAWLWGLELSPIDPVEIIVPLTSGARSRRGLLAHRCEISPGDVVAVRGLRATGIHRTLCDLCIRADPVEALVAIDRAVRLGLADVADLASQRRRGAHRLRSLARHAAVAESPMETRLRWLLIQAGLPRPEVQVNLRDREQRFVGRADLYYPAARLIIEYDGGNHRERLVEDDRRQNLLTTGGFRLLRFTAPDIYESPEVVVAQVRNALDVLCA
jgi:very-short-patch-repair endonuclease